MASILASISFHLFFYLYELWIPLLDGACLLQMRFLFCHNYVSRAFISENRNYDILNLIGIYYTSHRFFLILHLLHVNNHIEFHSTENLQETGHPYNIKFLSINCIDDDCYCLTNIVYGILCLCGRQGALV